MNVNRLSKRYPTDTRIKLIHMEDPYGVEDGTEGTVVFVDDEGQIHMDWDNGRSLALIPGVDIFVIIERGDD